MPLFIHLFYQDRQCEIMTHLFAELVLFVTFTRNAVIADVKLLINICYRVGLDKPR